MDMNRVSGSFSPGFAVPRRGTSLSSNVEDKEAATPSDGGSQIAPSDHRENLHFLCHAGGAAPDVSHIVKEIEEAPAQDTAIVEESDDMLSVDGIKLQVRRERE